MELGHDILVNFDGVEDISFSTNNCFAIVEDNANLVQAIKTRMLTKLKSLATHINFGSNVFNIYGQTASDETLDATGSYAYQTLADEPRIKEVVELNLDYRVVDGQKTLVITAEVLPIDSDVTLNLVVEVAVV
jgi:phage baseplate assembly protein W